jgi:hypothetical protein
MENNSNGMPFSNMYLAYAMLIDSLIEFYNIIRAGYVSQTTNTVEQTIGRKPISFEQFVRDHVSSFN